MKAILKKGLALTLAVTLCVTQTVLPVVAVGEGESPVPVTTSDTIDLPTYPGGGEEQVDVDVTISTDSQGNTTAVMETAPGGDTTDGGIIAEVQSEVTTDAGGSVIAEDTDYTAHDPDNIYTAQGGTDVSQSTEYTGELEVDLLTDGTVIPDAAATNDVAGETETTPTNPGDKLESEDPANFDQTTTEVETNRELTAEVTGMETTTTTPVFVDANGNVVELDETQAFHYYYETIYCVHNQRYWNTTYVHDATTCPTCGWSVGGSDWYAVDAEGNERKIDGEGVCQRVVYDNNGTPDDKSDDTIVNGLYCLDASTGIRSDYAYRMVNLEDAVDEGYYTAEEAAHLRAIMTYGYTWNDDADNGETNLANIKQMITDAKAKAEAEGDTATKELLEQIAVESLTRQQAATATGMAVWHYGNRFTLEEGETVKIKNGNASIDALYAYLITLTEEPKETQIIDEEKFIENLSITVGDKAEGDAANRDADNTNDVYNVDVKFSLVVKPDKDNDDLLVSVVNDAGVVVKTVRIAGTNGENEAYEDAKTEVGADGKEYYVIDGLQLAENANASFNIKLEGEQLLQEGVYVFESEHRTVEDAYAICYEYWTSDENWEGEKQWLESEKGYSNVTKEDYKEICKKLYFGKYMNEDGSFKEGVVINSQNFIGKFSGTADVSVNLAVDITFNVDESVVTTTREWRTEHYVAPDPAPIDGDDGGGGGAQVINEEPVPMGPQPRFGVYRRGAGQNGETVILDEEVPLAAAPKTGDASAVMAAMSLASLAGLLVISRKKEA